MSISMRAVYELSFTVLCISGSLICNILNMTYIMHSEKLLAILRFIEINELSLTRAHMLPNTMFHCLLSANDINLVPLLVDWLD